MAYIIIKKVGVKKMKNGRTFKQCEKIAQEMIETMFHVAFINHEEIEIYISSVNGKICTHTFKRGVVLPEFKDKKIIKEYHIKKLCESYFYNSLFGKMLHTPDEKDLAKKIYNYQRKVGVKNEL